MRTTGAVGSPKEAGATVVPHRHGEDHVGSQSSPEQLTGTRILSMSRISKHLTGLDDRSPRRHLTSVVLEGGGALWVVGWPGWSRGLLEGLAALEAAGPVSHRELERDAS